MSTPSGKISASQAKTLSDNWTTFRKAANDTAAGQPDNRSSWYSLEDMEAFIAMIKDENSDVNGVRCYLGVDTSESEKGMTTVFMVPTKSDRGKNKDISGANGMDMGENGNPPSASYPQ